VIDQHPKVVPSGRSVSLIVPSHASEPGKAATVIPGGNFAPERTEKHGASVANSCFSAKRPQLRRNTGVISVTNLIPLKETTWLAGPGFR
jgi:hypothetical protein